MKLDSARYVLVPIVTAVSGALATVGAAYVTDAGFATARDARLTPVEAATIVPTLVDPIYDGVEILKDVRIIDLRGYRRPLSHPPVRAHHDEAASLPWQHPREACGAED
jgi:hypothetical protein